MEVATENPVMPTEESPEQKSNRLRDQWIGFDSSLQYLLESIAKSYVFGEYNPTTGEQVLRMVSGDDGRLRRPTIAELVAEQAERRSRRWSIAADVAIAHVERIVAWLKNKQRHERLDAFLVALRRHRDCRLENYIAATDGQRRALAAITGYCEQISERVAAGEGMLLNGIVGTGKTHLLIGAARKAIGAYLTVEYRNVQQLLSDFRSRIGQKNGPTEGDMLDELVAPDVLILDDVLSPHSELSPYQEGLLFVVTERRYMAMRPTWVGLNVATAEDAERRIGAAIVDRWRDGALCLAFDWASHRKAAQ